MKTSNEKIQVIDLDGPTISDSKFFGPIGKLHFVAELEINLNFTQISIWHPLIKMREEVIQDLSTINTMDTKLYMQSEMECFL